MIKTFRFILLFISYLGFCQGNSSLYTDVKSYGAKGDGFTDDSNYIQRAVDYCESHSIKTLYFPAGKYYLKKTVTINNGGLQILGVGALLREESWINNQKNGVVDYVDPGEGGSIILVEKDIAGFTYAANVTDPVRIADIQFLSKNKRIEGNTIGIRFNSFFVGPTWPFIIERCNFFGFNYAIKFESPRQYNVAFVKIDQNAFRENDECIYFSDIPGSSVSNTGTRNMTWGFTFSNNKCHGNSRIIRGIFTNIPVNIISNNMEGNNKYANGKTPKNIIDCEISNTIVNFEGNYFESVISDCISISSNFTNYDGKVILNNNGSENSEKNKVFIKGNNFTYVSANFKPYILRGVLVYNYDPYNLYLENCDIRVNESNSLNMFLSDNAKKNGSILKLPVGKYETSFLSQKDYKSSFYDSSAEIANVASPLCNYNLINVKPNSSVDLFLSKMDFSSIDKFLGATFLVNNPELASDSETQVVFNIEYDTKNSKKSISINTYGTKGFAVGFSETTALVPVPNLPKDARNMKFSASLIVSKTKNYYLGSRSSLFTYKGENPNYIPILK